MNSVAIGVDIGGSHIACAAVNLLTHTIIPGSGSEAKIDNKAGADEILNGWAGTIEKSIAWIDNSKLAGIGFAMPGPFDYRKGIALFERVEKFESLYGVNISTELKKRLRIEYSMPFRYVNDATAFAIAEAWIGKAGNFHRVIALTLGTGFGSAFIRNGIPMLSGENVPEMGCVWHIPYKDGIANDYFSTPWFTRRYFEKTGVNVRGVKEIAELADHEDFAFSLFKEYGSNLGVFLAPWISKFDAEVVVIGGNITGAFPLFGKYLNEAIEKTNPRIEILLSDLKENAAIIGGARLLDDKYWNDVKDLLSMM
jgi:glucokinase